MESGGQRLARVSCAGLAAAPEPTLGRHNVGHGRVARSDGQVGKLFRTQAPIRRRLLVAPAVPRVPRSARSRLAIRGCRGSARTSTWRGIRQQNGSTPLKRSTPPRLCYLRSERGEKSSLRPPVRTTTAAAKTEESEKFQLSRQRRCRRSDCRRTVQRPTRPQTL